MLKRIRDVLAVTPEVAARLGLASRGGALVTDVVPGGPAPRAGVRAGDLIVAFQGTPVRRAGELPRLVARASAGSEAELRVSRNGREQAVTVTLGELPERPGR